MSEERPPTERHLTAVRRRDADAFAVLFDRHWSAVHSYARRRVATADDAHDVAADTFTVAWRRFEDIPADHALPWLYRTASNVLRNQRRGARRQDRLASKLATLGQPTADDPADIASDDDVLVSAFRALHEDDREVLRLVAWEGLSNADIGAVLDVSTNAAALRVSRARRRLEELIDGSMTASEAAGHAGVNHHPATDPNAGRQP